MPNTKSKKFDFQIFLAVLCILLVICSATLCCVFSNNNKGVARADEPAYDAWDVNGGFYTKKITNRSDLQSIVNYYFSFIPESQDIKFCSYIIGKLRFAYINGSNSFETVDLFMSVDLASISAINYTYFTIKLYDSSMENTIDFITIIDDGTIVVTANYWQSYSSSSSDNYYFYSLTGDWTNSGNFLNRFLTFALGSVSDFQELVSFGFSTYSTASIRWLVSQTDFFDDIPLPPVGNDRYDEGYQVGYDEGYQVGYDEGFDSGYDFGIVDGSTGSYAQGYKDALESFKSINLTSNIDYFNRYSYQYLDGNLWRQADTDQIKSSVWLNNAPSEYLFTSNYFNLSGLNQFLIPLTEYKNFTLFASERHVGDSTLSITLAVESLDESFSISFYDGDRLTYNLELSTTYQNGVPVSYGTLPIGFPFTHIVLNYIDDNALFTLDAINQIVITANNFVVDSYNTALDQGYKNGYEQGYNFARDKYINNDYSFFALFSGVLDAPLQVIIGSEEKPGMLNFYIPGLDINIAPFLLSLFTVALVITVIRFILARAS